jgi:hypothetical protein
VARRPRRPRRSHGADAVRTLDACLETLAEMRLLAPDLLPHTGAEDALEASIREACKRGGPTAGTAGPSSDDGYSYYSDSSDGSIDWNQEQTLVDECTAVALRVG